VERDLRRTIQGVVDSRSTMWHIGCGNKGDGRVQTVDKTGGGLPKIWLDRA